jgi:hypothetical protein
MSRTGIPLGGVLAGKNRFRFTRHGHYNRTSLNDVAAFNK